MLFPSKFHKTWDNWQESLLSYGDFITNIDGYKETFVLYNVFGRDTCEAYDSNGSNTIISKIEYRWATDEEKNGFLAELDRNGLIWNPFTNEMEIKPKPYPNKELIKVKEYACERWHKLWQIIPDADKPDITKEDLNNIGRFMEIEKLNDFLNTL